MSDWLKVANMLADRYRLLDGAPQDDSKSQSVSHFSIFNNVFLCNASRNEKISSQAIKSYFVNCVSSLLCFLLNLLVRKAMEKQQ